MGYKRSSLFLAAAPLRAPTLKLGDGAPTSGAEKQHGSAVGGRHPAELGAEALVVGIVPLLASLPGKAVDLLPHGGGGGVRWGA